MTLIRAFALDTGSGFLKPFRSPTVGFQLTHVALTPHLQFLIGRLLLIKYIAKYFATVF